MNILSVLLNAPRSLVQNAMPVPRPIPSALKALAAKKTHPVTSPTHSDPHQTQHQHQQQKQQQKQEEGQQAAVGLSGKEALPKAGVVHPGGAQAQQAPGASALCRCCRMRRVPKRDPRRAESRRPLLSVSALGDLAA